MSIESVLLWFVGLAAAACVALVVVLGWVVWADSRSPTIELRRDQWKCTKSEARTRMQPMLVGKVTTLLSVADSVCVEYTRIGG